MSTRSLSQRPIRALIAKIGLDGHDRGVRIVAKALRDAGVEVIYIGPWAELDAVVVAAVHEDVDVVGISSLAYDHLLVPDLVAKLRAAGWDGPVVVGGIVQAADLPLLEECGVAGVFHPGEPIDEMVRAVCRLARPQEVVA